MLSNLETEKDKLLQILLIGQPEFLDMLNSTELRQLNQRITVRTHLSAFSPEEMQAYITHRLRIAGNERSVQFTASALKKIYAYSEGIPRKTNVLCDYILLAGYAENTSKINASLVEKAIEDIVIKRDPERVLAPSSKKHITRYSLRILAQAAVLLLAIFLFRDPIRQGAGSFSEYCLQVLKSSSSALDFLDAATIEVEYEKQVESEGQIQSEKIVEENFSQPEKTETLLSQTPITGRFDSAEQTSSAVDSSSKLPVTLAPGAEPPPFPVEADLKPAPTTQKPETPEPSAPSFFNPIPPTIGKSGAAERTSFTVSESFEYFNTLSSEEKALWLLLSTWGLDIRRDRRDASGERISFKQLLDRFSFTSQNTWADLALLKKINLPCALLVQKDGEKKYWVLNAIKDNRLRFFTAPEEIVVILESEFTPLWQGSSIVLVEKGENTLLGDSVIYKGLQSPDVIQLKDILKRHSLLPEDSALLSELPFTGVHDNLFDVELEQAVKKFQTDMGLTEDGIVGVEAKLLFYSKLSKNIPRLLVLPIINSKDEKA
jgi:hypothetical protein